MFRVVGHIWSIGWVSSPKGHLLPTTLPAPTAMVSTRFVCSVSWGASSPSVPLVVVFVYALGSQGSETEPLDDPAHSHRSHCILPCSRRLAYHTLALHMCTTASVHVQEGSAATLHLPPETNPTRLLCAEYSPGLRPQPRDAPKGAPSIRTRPQSARHHAACTTYPWLLPTRCDHTKVTLALIRPRISSGPY